MAKQNKSNTGSSTGTQKKGNTRMLQVILAVAVVAAIIAVFVIGSRNSAQDSQQVADFLSASSSLRDRMVLPATPRRPRPVTLDPNNYSDPETRASYQAAKDAPEVLEHMPCYCGCFKDSAHRNNLDCFKDAHGET